ncbi:MAG TPA: recombinase family protein [Verrucomicrobiae bacterium]|nr:recombinase family protein [Verrucomicrobiae bacterium]
MLVYTRQSVSDFDTDGRPRGPSLSQQLDAVLRRPELEGLAFEHFEDADRSGKETSRRPGYLALMERIRTVPTGQVGAVAFYDADRLHRNDVEFFRFMAEMTERRILVFDANSLISNVDRLSWKIKAIVAQEEREKVSRRVRDNLRYLQRNGQLLGTIPQGYRRVDGRIVEDPDAAPAIKEIFRLYATGRFSLRSLAEHLNRSGIKPYRGPDKANHNRSKAIIFTGDVLKDLIGNPSYAGKVLVEGELVQGLHAALVDEETWRACQEVKKRNVRRTSKAWTKHTYPLTPILLCARCGGPMHGEADSRKGRIQRYYGCHVARRNRSAVHPSGPRCDARMFKCSRMRFITSCRSWCLAARCTPRCGLAFALLAGQLHPVQARLRQSSVWLPSLIAPGDSSSTGSTTGRRSASDVTSSTSRGISLRTRLTEARSTLSGANPSCST